MASFTANHCFSPYSDTHITTDAFHNEQPVPEEYLFALTLPHNESTVLQEETAFSTPTRSTGMRPGSSTGSVSGLIGLGGNINKSFDMLGNSFSMWSSNNQSVLMGQIPYGLPAYNLTPSYFVPGSMLPTFDIDSYLVSTRDMWTEAPSVFQNNSVGTLNIQVPSGESLPFGNPAQRGEISENDEQQLIDLGFDISDLPRALYEPTISPITDPQPSLENRAQSIMRGPPYVFDDLLQNISNSFHGPMMDVLPQAYQKNEVSDVTPPELCRFLGNKRAPSHPDSLGTASPPKRARTISKYCVIASKSTTSSADIIEDISNDSAKPQESKKGGRNRPLTPKTRENAAKVRVRGACAPCRRSKIKCDLIRPICANCQKKYARHTLRFGCNIGPLQEYTGAFTPDVLTGDLTQWAIDKWIKEKHIVFTAHTMRVSASLDPFGVMMSLPVHEIYSADQDYLQVPVLAVEPRDTPQRFATRPSLQYGIYDCPIAYLRQIYKEYINTVSRHPVDTMDGMTGDTLGIIWKILGVIQLFAKASLEGNLIHKAMNVFWMHYLMGRSLVLSEDSARKAIESLQNSMAVLPPQPFVSAGLVSRQMKVAMKLSLEESMQDLLLEVDKEFKHDQKSWAVCFCVVLILCILVEQAQAATDAFVTDKVSRESHDAAGIRKAGIKACQDLEEPINYVWERFQKVQGKHNPVKNGHPISPQKQEEDLIREIRDILTNNEEDISERAEDTCLGGFSDNPADHDKFYMRNSARYVSKFLRIFC